MARRLTQKQETFCLNLFQGMSQRDAYIEAGYSPKQSPATLDRHACELAKTDKILARWEELRQAAENASVASVLEREQILSEIIRTNHTGIMEISEDGRSMAIKPEALESPAVSYVRTEQIAYDKMPVRVTRVGLIDKVRAVAELNKMQKLYSDGATVNVDNRKIEIHVYSEKAKELTEKIIDGERTQS